MTAALVLAALGVSIAVLLVAIQKNMERRHDDPKEALIDAIDALLPQTQCAQCGYPGCRPYARAIADGGAIDLCPPGGQATIEDLGALLGREVETSLEEPVVRLAAIRPGECIGCVKCIDVCPVDAIVGAPRRLHAVIERYCTGCELCIPACPVDCIDLLDATKGAERHVANH